MRICVIYYKYPLYPQGSYFQEFLNKLAESVDKIYLLAVHHPRGSFKSVKNIKFFWIPLINTGYIEEVFFAFSVFLRVIFNKELHKVDVINSVGPRGLLAGWYLKKKYKIPLVCTIEMINEKGSLVNNIYYILVRFLLTKIPIDKFICWSNYYWENHLKQWGIPKSKVVVISAGIDTKIYNPSVDGNKIKKKYAPNNPLIIFAKPLYSTNTESAKLLVQSIALLKFETKIKLLIGRGEGQKEVQELSKDLGIAAQVNFMPPTPFPEIPKYIATADLIVLPFTYAPTTSRSLLEAMAMGKPIITTNVGEIPNIIKNGKETLLVNPKKEEIAKAIKQIFNGKIMAASLGRNAINLVKSKYALPLIINETIKIYEETILSVERLKNSFDGE